MEPSEVNMKKYVVIAALSFSAWSAKAQINTAPVPDNSLPAGPSNIVLPELQLRGTLPTMFAALVKEAGLSGGIATSNVGCSRPESSLHVSAGTTFDRAVARVTKTGPASQWELRDGVANLWPGEAVPPLLQVPVRSFTWDKAAPVREVLDRLRQLPEVVEEASKLGLREAPLQGGASSICIRGDCGEKRTIQAMVQTEEGVSLYMVLNRVVQAHSGAVWNYSDYRCNNVTLFSLGVVSE
jgi:hypothetical protein